MNIEDAIYEDALPVNTIAMANRLKEILKQNDTNCALSLKTDPKRKEGLIKFKRALWLINQQIYGQVGTIDMMEEWGVLTQEYK